MAQAFPKFNYFRTRSSTRRFQWPKDKVKPSLFRKASAHRTGEMKTLTRVPSELKLQVTTDMTNLPKTPTGQHKKEQVHHGKTQSKVRFMRSMLRNQRASLQELYDHENFLNKLNEELMQTIQSMEDSMTVNVRSMLQQQSTLGNIINILEYSNKKRVEQLKSELQEWEEKEESKAKCLQQQVDQLNAEIQKTQEEVSFLSTYMDHEYNIRSVQIANHIRQLQQAKYLQMDELEKLNEMREMVLKCLSNDIQERKKKILKSVVERIQRPHERILLAKSQDIQCMQRCIVWFREFIEQLKKELPVLRATVEQLQTEFRDPREIAFEDVLLPRSKCTPDMAIVLNVPEQEEFSF